MYKALANLKVKGWKKIFHAYGNQKESWSISIVQILAIFYGK